MFELSKRNFWDFEKSIGFIVSCLIIGSLAHGQEADDGSEGGLFSRFIDPEDGRLDITANSEGGASGFLPVVFPFNEPSVGGGLLIAPVYFHDDPDGEEEPDGPSSNLPPSATFGALAYTSNESWVGVGGHSGVWKDGRLRYLGLGGAASINLDFYGVGDEPGAPPSDSPAGFNIEGGLLMQQMLFRLRDSHFYAGFRYLYMDANVNFGLADRGRAQNLGDLKDAGIAALLNFDSRDNTFTPNKGTKASISISSFSQSLGGDFSYDKLGLTALQYWSLKEDRLSLGLRFHYAWAGDDAPFFTLPFVQLRGIPALRYMGHYMSVTELEPRWKIDERWSVLAFAGFGRAANSFDGLSDATNAYNYGTGFRYLLSKGLGLGVGFDVARGPEDTVLYIMLGNARGF